MEGRKLRNMFGSSTNPETDQAKPSTEEGRARMSPAGPEIRVAHAPSIRPILRPIASCIFGTNRSISWPGLRCSIMIVTERSSRDRGSFPLPAKITGQNTLKSVASPLTTLVMAPLYS